MDDFSEKEFKKIYDFIKSKLIIDKEKNKKIQEISKSKGQEIGD